AATRAAHLAAMLGRHLDRLRFHVQRDVDDVPRTLESQDLRVQLSVLHAPSISPVTPTPSRCSRRKPPALCLDRHDQPRNRPDSSERATHVQSLPAGAAAAGPPAPPVSRLPCRALTPTQIPDAPKKEPRQRAGAPVLVEKSLRLRVSSR